MRPDIYTPTFLRALIWYCNNGFFARDLDADDVAFLERVRERGSVACGSLAQACPTDVATFDYSRRQVFDEELDYWESPWAIAHGIPRRNGPIIRPPKRPHKPSEWMREREANRAVMQAELAREQKAWDERQAALAKERENRLLQTMLDDIEWENAHPHIVAQRNDDASFAPYEDRPKRQLLSPGSRHYEPFWKREERLAPQRRQQAKESLKAKRAQAKREKVALETLAEQRRAAAAMPLGEEFGRQKFDLLKQTIELIMAANPTQPRWDLEFLMREANCSEPDLALRCCQAIVEERRQAKAAQSDHLENADAEARALEEAAEQHAAAEADKAYRMAVTRHAREEKEERERRELMFKIDAILDRHPRGINRPIQKLMDVTGCSNATLMLRCYVQVMKTRQAKPTQ